MFKKKPSLREIITKLADNEIFTQKKCFASSTLTVKVTLFLSSTLTVKVTLFLTKAISRANCCPCVKWLLHSNFRKINYNRLPVGFVYVAYISILWHHEKEVRQWTFHAMSRHSLITIVWWYNILYRTPLTEKFLFSLSKANLYNVRYYSAKKNDTLSENWKEENNKSIYITYCYFYYCLILIAVRRDNINYRTGLWSGI